MIEERWSISSSTINLPYLGISKQQPSLHPLHCDLPTCLPVQLPPNHPLALQSASVRLNLLVPLGSHSPIQHFPSPQFPPPGLQQTPSMIISPCLQHCPPTSTSPPPQHKFLAAFAQCRFVPKTGPCAENGLTGSQHVPPQTS